MYEGVPSACPATVASGERINCDSCAISRARMSFWPRALARPQSSTTVSPNSPTMTFSGLRSRCTTPRAWAYATAWQMSAKWLSSLSRSAAVLACSSTFFKVTPRTSFCV